MSDRILWLLFLCLPLTVAAQQEVHDSLHPDTLQVSYVLQTADFWLKSDSVELNTDLDSYSSFNPLDHITWSQSSGVMGSPYQILWFPEHIDQLHPDNFAFLHRPDDYLFFRDDIPYFTSKTPFSFVSYSNGYQREQYFDFLHSQPLGKCWRLTLDYRLINAPGAYKNQKASHTHFFGTTEYASKKGNYKMVAGVIFNRIYQQENGGLSFTTDFIDTTVYDRQLADVQLLTAQNRFRQNDYFITNELRFGQKDSAGRKLFLQHTINLRREYHVYSDTEPLSGYYPQILLDSTATRDSVAHYAFENSLTLGNRSASKWRWFISFLHTADHLYNAQSDSSMSQKILKAGLAWHFSGKYVLSVQGTSDVVPLNDGDRDVHFELSTSDVADWKPYARLSYCLISPNVYYSQYSGNHLSWMNDWQQTKTVLAMAGLGYKNISLSAFYSQFDKHLYHNGLSFVQGGKGTAVGALLKTDIRFGRFGLRATAGYQYMSGSSCASVAPWFAKGEFTMKNSIFKKALSLQTGLSAWINASYYADAYNPVIQTFVVQNSIKTGGFVYPTLFVRAQIKRAVVFAELVNFTAGLTKVNYWQIPGYPLPDRGFRFGLTWSFLN